MSAFLTAIGLVLVIEGLLYGAFPSIAKKMAEMLRETPEETVRVTGLGAALVGLFVVWLSLG